MDLYLVALATGAVGLGIMAVGGLSHGTHGHGHGDGAHAEGAGHGHGHSHAGDPQAGHGHAAGHGSHGHHGEASHGFAWSSLLSPRLLFALMVGFGAGGVVATPLAEPLRFGAAILAAATAQGKLTGRIIF